MYCNYFTRYTVVKVRKSQQFFFFFSNRNRYFNPNESCREYRYEHQRAPAVHLFINISSSYGASKFNELCNRNNVLHDCRRASRFRNVWKKKENRKRKKTNMQMKRINWSKKDKKKTNENKNWPINLLIIRMFREWSIALFDISIPNTIGHIWTYLWNETPVRTCIYLFIYLY